MTGYAGEGGVKEKGKDQKINPTSDQRAGYASEPKNQTLALLHALCIAILLA